MALKSIDAAIQEELQRRKKEAEEENKRQILLQQEKEKRQAEVASEFVAYIAESEHVDISTLDIEASESVERRVYDIVIKFGRTGAIKCQYDCDSKALKSNGEGRFYRSIRHTLNGASLYTNYDSIVSAVIYAKGLN